MIFWFIINQSINPNQKRKDRKENKILSHVWLDERLSMGHRPLWARCPKTNIGHQAPFKNIQCDEERNMVRYQQFSTGRWFWMQKSWLYISCLHLFHLRIQILRETTEVRAKLFLSYNKKISERHHWEKNCWALDFFTCFRTTWFLFSYWWCQLLKEPSTKFIGQVNLAPSRLHVIDVNTSCSSVNVHWLF